MGADRGADQAVGGGGPSAAAGVTEGTPRPGATWWELHAEALDRLSSVMEARWLVEELATGTWPGVLDQVVTARAAARFEELVNRRAAGEPFQYVLGHWPFRSLDLLVDDRVLIPRPETEVVAGVALAELERLAAAGPAAPVAVDLGTGSGAIALSLALEHPGVQVWATDASPEALSVARANLAGIGSAATRVRLARGSWWAALPPELAGTISLAVSNPPYVSTAELRDLDPGVTGWEPRSALEAGPAGTEDIEAILEQAPAWLAPRAVVVIELAPHQAVPVAELARRAGLAAVEVLPDLAGRPRVLVARTGIGPRSAP